VTEFSVEDRTLANAPWPHEDIFTKMVGVPALGGEHSFPPAERRGMRPTIEVNGIYSGYQGPGDKTIIPSIATCKLTSRLVASQDPARCLRLLEEFLKANAPKGLQFMVTGKRVGGKALALSSEEPLVAQARAVLDEVSGVKTQFTWEGGSIPIVADLAEISGAKPLLVGFALEEDKAHAPNESFALSQFKLGFLYASRMLQELSKP
jgi:acetylornithine deacetylase/succinyl-diaminopimelate desuccinylase-like protein